MNPLFAQIAMLAVFAAPGVLLLAWAIASRQFPGREDATLAINRDEDHAPAAIGRRASRKSRLGIVAILTAFFLLSVCPVGLTLYMVISGENAHKAGGQAVQPPAHRRGARSGDNTQ